MKKIFTLILAFSLFNSTLHAQWIAQPLGFSSPVMVYEMEAVSPAVVWAAGSDTINNTGQTYVKSVDGGFTWQSGQVNNLGPDFIINNITATSADTAWVVLVDDANGGGLIKKTTNGGQNWQTQGTNAFTDPASYPSVIHFFDGKNGVAFGDAVNGHWEVYTTSNSGTTWARRPAADVPNIISTGFGDEFTMYAKAAIGNLIWVGTSEGRIFRSDDKGLTWAAATTLLDGIQAIAFTDPFNGLAMSAYGEMAATNNGGVTWTPVSPQGDVYDYDMAAVPNMPGVFVTTGFNAGGFAGSSYTLDGGLNWSVLDSMPHMAVAFADANTGWASGRGSRISYRWSSAILGTDKDVAGLIPTVFPNPANGYLFIHAPVAVEEIVICDITGRQVFASDGITENHKINISHLRKGLYTVILKTARQTTVQKLLLN